MPGPFVSFRPGDTLDINPYASVPQHVRLHLPPSWDFVQKQDEFAVVSVWPGPGKDTLFVATGSGNDVQYRNRGYRFIVAVTWCKDFTSNPPWFRDVFLSVAHCLALEFGEKVDVLALSRGVQAVMCCYDGDDRDVDAFANSVGNVVLAGGCIWERQDHGLPGRVIKHLTRLKDRLKRPPLFAIVVSEMDGNVRRR